MDEIAPVTTDEPERAFLCAPQVKSPAARCTVSAQRDSYGRLPVRGLLTDGSAQRV